MGSITEDKTPSKQFSAKVGIIGAGIAGLITAIVLTDAGHDVEIYEKSRFANEIGAGIHTTPNASRVLKHYGFDFEAAKASGSGELAYLDADKATVLRSMKYPDCEEVYGAPWYTFHRADLHSELKRHATEGSTPGSRVAQLHLQSPVKDVDVDGTIVLASGETIKKDLVIIADGVHTELIEKVTQQPVELQAAGRAMMRFLVPMDQVAADPRTSSISDGLTRFLYAIKGDRNFVSYPCRSGIFANCGIFYPDTVDWQGSWSLKSSKEDLLKVIDGYHDMFVALCDKASDVSTWRLATRKQPVETLYKGRLVLVGDALHPMLPFLGQGGAMAIEDAGALGVLLSSMKSLYDIDQRLPLYQELRKNRVCAMQHLSSWGTLGYDTVIERSRPYLGAGTPGDREAINEWCFAPDVMKDAAELLKQHLKSPAATV